MAQQVDQPKGQVVLANLPTGKQRFLGFSFNKNEICIDLFTIDKLKLRSRAYIFDLTNPTTFIMRTHNGKS